MERTEPYVINLKPQGPTYLAIITVLLNHIELLEEEIDRLHKEIIIADKVIAAQNEEAKGKR